jgi:hypothetical protein
MKNEALKRILTPIVSLCLTLFVSAQPGEQDPVRKAFDSYKAAILNDKGADAVNLVDSKTIKYYGEVLDWVKNADSAKVETLSLLNKLMVFTVRHRAPKEDILSFDGKSLLKFAIESGMVGKNSVANTSIGDVTIDGNFAKGQFVANGVKAPFNVQFNKEEGQWKIDLTSLFAVSTAAFEKIAADSGKNENDFLFDLLEMVSGTKPGQEIWQPVK